MKVELVFGQPVYDPSDPVARFLADYLHHGPKDMSDELTKDMIASALGEFAKQKANCDSCVFFRREPIEDPLPRNGGRCKRFPPVPDNDYMFGQFPAVIPQDWCGEHRPAADVENEV